MKKVIIIILSVVLIVVMGSVAFAHSGDIDVYLPVIVNGESAPTLRPTRTPRPTPTLAPTMNPWDR